MKLSKWHKILAIYKHGGFQTSQEGGLKRVVNM